METIKLISGSYLYKDILMIDKIRNSSLIETYLKHWHSSWREVSFSELSRLTGADRGTIEKYVRILEDAFILFRLSGFSRNVRTELRKSKKFYFWDNGVRNAIIGNFNPLDSRSDTGALWETTLCLKVKTYSFTKRTCFHILLENNPPAGNRFDRRKTRKLLSFRNEI